MKAILLLFLMSSLARAAEPEKRASAGYISAIDTISRVHITNLLLGHGIASSLPGSVIHVIEVPLSQEQEAIRLIRADAPKRGYCVWFPKKGQMISATDEQVGTSPELDARLSRMSFKAALARPNYSGETILGKFLRSKEVTKHTIKYPFIASLKVAERQYLATPNALQTGFEVELTVRNTLNKKGKEFSGRYQILDGGHQIESMGSIEGDFADE